ncbi:hypothetical protein Gorai_008276 [Gossypium raimondii]|uniref:Uncharacterized protein n=1 Tax=Gossypium raimondii TaxID=29730 RepID=A0A7J8QAP4_GOSRA|nr:hypothetical protein [Gossypium raimondii]
MSRKLASMTPTLCPSCM